MISFLYYDFDFNDYNKHTTIASVLTGLSRIRRQCLDTENYKDHQGDGKNNGKSIDKNEQMKNKVKQIKEVERERKCMISLWYDEPLMLILSSLTLFWNNF